MPSISSSTPATSSGSTNSATNLPGADGTSSLNSTSFSGLGRVNNPIQQQQNQQQGQSSGQSSHQDVTLLNSLLGNFGEMIGLADLELNDQNRCSLLLGDDDASVQVTMELAADGTLCFYTIMDKDPNGVSEQLKEQISEQPEGDDGTYLSLSGSGSTVFLCLNAEVKSLNGLDFETLVRDFYSSANQWKRKYEELRRPMTASSALLNRPAAKDKKIMVARYVDKATGFLTIAYIIYRMGGVLA